MNKNENLFIGNLYWTYECWKMYNTIIEYEVGIEEAEGIWDKIGLIISEYVLLQIAKINDPAESNRNNNLSLEWFIKVCVKSNKATQLYEKFRSDNRDFIAAVKTVRHKVISHSDLATYQKGACVGIYRKGFDEQYFISLHALLSNCYVDQNWGTFPDWPSFITGDTARFMQKLSQAFPGILFDTALKKSE